jgi:hypothetical protein
MVATFGRGTIRRFGNNVSGMKKLAGRDFEDILQVCSEIIFYLFMLIFYYPCTKCIIPVIEDLLPPPHNNVILDLLFELASWHAFAKLRIHTDITLDLFQAATRSLSASVRQFLRTTCEEYITQELPKEAAARGRRKAALVAKGAQAGSVASGKASIAPKFKKLNFKTYKYHALADYPDTIRRFGTTDNYNTQTVRLSFFF